MGQKVNPRSFRLQSDKKWAAKWFTQKKSDNARFIKEDSQVRDLIEKRFNQRPTIGLIKTERSSNALTVTIYTAKAGVVIGKGGAGVQELKEQLEKIVKLPVKINVEEIKRPDLSAKLVAEGIAHQLERRINFRRAMKNAIQNTTSAGAKGIRVEVAGRLNGAEMSRREKMIEGSVPLQTIRSNIDYHCATAKTAEGVIGVKVWICKGERN